MFQLMGDYKNKLNASIELLFFLSTFCCHSWRNFDINSKIESEMKQNPQKYQNWIRFRWIIRYTFNFIGCEEDKQWLFRSSECSFQNQGQKFSLPLISEIGVEKKKCFACFIALTFLHFSSSEFNSIWGMSTAR